MILRVILSAWTLQAFLLLFLAATVATQKNRRQSPPIKIREPEDEPALLWHYQNLTSISLGGNMTTADGLLPNRIVGGHRINIHETPWQVAIYLNGYFLCGGSILTRRWVLTAAHCVVGSNGGVYQIRAASSNHKRGGELRRVVKIVWHRKFKLRTMSRDIALMQVRGPFHFNRRCQPVRLPKAYSSKRPRTFQVSGWGVQQAGASNTPKYLRAVDVNYVKKAVCQRRYRRPITRFMLCAAAPGRDSCSGDSGGCLTHDGICFGIVSFGYGCANRRYPGVYTNVALLVPWIKRAIKANS